MQKIEKKRILITNIISIILGIAFAGIANHFVPTLFFFLPWIGLVFSVVSITTIFVFPSILIKRRHALSKAMCHWIKSMLVCSFALFSGCLICIIYYFTELAAYIIFVYFITSLLSNAVLNLYKTFIVFRNIKK